MSEPLPARPTPRIIIVGPLPPPVHGFALATEGLVTLLERAGAKPLVFNLAAPGSRRELAYHVERARRVLFAAIALVQERRLRGDPVRVHIGCDGGAGLLYTLALTAAARLAGCSLRFHHHSYASCDRWRLLMSALLRLGGKQASHVVLRPPMADALRRRYGHKLQVTTLSNAAFVPPAPRIAVNAQTLLATQHPLTIGMLGNLDADKGLDLFLRLTDALRTEGACVRCVIAGPIATWSDRNAVAGRVADGSLEWTGPVQGQAKRTFYQRIDLLLFPSRYLHEAEPMVLLEAMAHGVPVIAADRGCIRDLTGDAGVVIPPGADFVAEAIRLIRAIIADRAWLLRHGANAQRRFRAERATALRQAADLLDLPPPEPETVAAAAHLLSDMPYTHRLEQGRANSSRPGDILQEGRRHA